MAKFAVVKTGGKQYLVQENDELIVDRLALGSRKTVELETLAIFEDEGEKIQLGTPLIKTKTEVEIIENIKGDKIRISRFKSKVRYRKVKGFRQHVSKIKILKI